jgi:type VI secretion system protein ImpM
METITRQILCFGKLPVSGDFVRCAASGAGVQAIDAWFQKGLYAVRARMPAAFEEAYDAAPACSFLFNPRNGAAALAGVMKPSRDRSGRRYPFLVAAELDASLRAGREAARIPVRFGPFFEWATDLVCEATAGRLSHHDLPDHLEAFSSTPDEASARSADYDRFLHETPFAGFAEDIWGDASGQRAGLLLKNLRDIVVPIRGTVPAHFALGLRFPLLREASRRAFSASFWLEAGLRLLESPDVRPTCFWTAGEAAPHPFPFLMMYLQTPPGRAFEDLLPAAPVGERLCILDEMGVETTPDPAASLPARYAALLGPGRVSLRDVRERL